MSKLDFSQRYNDEVLADFEPITKEQYIEIFDTLYPNFKDINVSQKMFNVIPLQVGAVVENALERDEL